MMVTKGVLFVLISLVLVLGVVSAVWPFTGNAVRGNQDGFKIAKGRCWDNTKFSFGDASSCKTRLQWRAQAVDFCDGKCRGPVARLKCGLKAFSVKKKCATGNAPAPKDEMKKLPDLIPRGLSLYTIGVFNSTACSVGVIGNITSNGSIAAEVSNTSLVLVGDDDFVYPENQLFDTHPLEIGSVYNVRYFDYKLSFGRLYNLNLTADWYNQVAESKESNNMVSTGYFNLTNCSLRFNFFS
ncbi:MAG TPA: CARDB domain-containing protein [Candidatus Nanoarchaeia archaeon]|nr:CARDB domain-containing protein [Candidatus Nanoarchaeia archaeon]